MICCKSLILYFTNCINSFVPKVNEQIMLKKQKVIQVQLDSICTTNLIKTIPFTTNCAINIFIIDSQEIMLSEGPQSSNYLRSSSKLPPLKNFGAIRVTTENHSDSDVQSTMGMKKKPKPGYQHANYTASVEYLHSQSYTKKVISDDGSPTYEPYQLCVQTQTLKTYGLGVYLYLEFIKRLAITFLIMSTIYIVPIVYAYVNGTGLDSYKESYMIHLAKTSLGNVQDGDRVMYIIFTAADILSMIALFAFYLHWRSFHNEAVSQLNKSPEILNPTMYSLSVVGFDPKTANLEKNLEEYINSIISEGTSVQVHAPQYINPNKPYQDMNRSRFKAYEVSAIYNYQGEFSKFVEYDQLVQKKQKVKQSMLQKTKSSEQLRKIEKEINQLQEQLSKVSNEFQAYEAIIHFDTIKGKHKFIRFCKNYALIDKSFYALKRFFCCQHLPPQNKLFMGKEALMIKSTNLSRPQQINWPNLDISVCSRIFRWIFSIIFLLISILITSSAIGLCTLYVSSTSACTNFNENTLLTQALSQKGQTLYCYCAVHFTQIYTDEDIHTACSELSNTILYANIMQIGASLISAISNFLLVIAVGLISRYVLKPDSKPKEYSFIFVGVLLSNYINSSILPLVMNGDIYGFQSLSYLKFINFIDFSKVAIFRDYTTDWYAVVGPYYMNFLIIAVLSPIINLIITCLLGCYTARKVMKACQNNDKDDIVIQKQADKMITNMEFDLATEKAIICLNFIISIMYSSLLPVLIPITTIYLLVTFFCKKTIILRYSIRIPADEALSQKILTLLPFVLLIHFLMGIWSHSAEGVFGSQSFVVKLEQHFFDGEMNKRIFMDLIMSGGAALIGIWIIFDYTILNFFALVMECFERDSDEVILPNELATKENRSFKEALKGANILGSYKLVNHPTHGHAIKAFNELKRRKARQEMRKTRNQQSTQGNSSPLKLGQRTTDTFNVNDQIPANVNNRYQQTNQQLAMEMSNQNSTSRKELISSNNLQIQSTQSIQQPQYTHPNVPNQPIPQNYQNQSIPQNNINNYINNQPQMQPNMQPVIPQNGQQQYNYQQNGYPNQVHS